MNEIELKFQIPPEHRDALSVAVAGRQSRPRQRLQAAYYDTPDRLLAQAGLAWRLRREGRVWVQTLKGAAEDGLTRFEHNVPVAAKPGESPSAPPSIDPQRHADTPVGQRLLALLADDGESALQVLFRTDIWRRTRLLRVTRDRQAVGLVELAFDEGHIIAGGRRLAVCELEIELKHGSPEAVIEAARGWVPRFGLWLDVRTKAERGELLLRGLSGSPPCAVAPVSLSADMTAQQGWALVLGSCSRAILANASQISSGSFEPEHVHQLRVALRKLRTGLRLFKPVVHVSGLPSAAATLFRQLGSSRDRAVLQERLSAGSVAGERPSLLAALHRFGWEAPSLPQLDTAGLSGPAERLREPVNQAFALDLLQAVCQLQPSEETPVQGPGSVDRLLAKRLGQWHRRAVANAGRWAHLDNEGRHELRKQFKQLRYGVEFSAALWPRRQVRAYLRRLARLQNGLGELADLAMAMQAYQPTAAQDGATGFVLGWWAAKQEGLIDSLSPQLDDFIQCPRCWKKD